MEGVTEVAAGMTVDEPVTAALESRATNRVARRASLDAIDVV